MTWGNVRFGSILTHNTDGTVKDQPKFWTPDRGIFSVPPPSSDHGRPFMILQSEIKADVVAMKIFPDQIVARFREQDITLLKL